MRRPPHRPRNHDIRRPAHTPTLLLALVLCLFVLVARPAEAQATIPTLRHGSRTDPRVALTFDDNLNGPGARAVLRILQSTGTKATVFVIGQNVVGSPSLSRAIAASGVEVGDHSMNHRHVTALSPTQMASEIGGGTDAFRRLTGHSTARLFRPPYGESDARVAAAAAADGMRAIVLWDVDTKDWQGRSAAAITRSAVNDARNGSIILMHLNGPHTFEALPGVIAGLKARGFRLVTVSELLAGSTGAHASTATKAPAPQPEPALPRVPVPKTRPLTPDEQAVRAAIDAGVMRPARGLALSPDRPVRRWELDAMLRRVADLRLPSRYLDGPAPDPVGGPLVLRMDLAVSLAREAQDVGRQPAMRVDALRDQRLRFRDVPAGLRGVAAGVVALGLMPSGGAPRALPTGTGPHFLPWTPVTRAEAARALQRLLTLPRSASWAEPALLLMTREDPFWGDAPAA